MAYDRRAVIFANGDLPDPAALKRQLHPGDLLVAADGGLRHIYSLGLQPHWLIGDLDSVSAEDVQNLSSSGVRILRFPVDKNETDLELALAAVLASGYKTIRVAGATGGRLDQTLGNLFLLQLPDLAGCDTRLENGQEEVFLIRQAVEISGTPGDILSLLPLGGPASGVWTRGLKYPLHGETLWPERTRGISNVLLETSAHVQLERGVLICIHTRNYD
jgi:thiamine pyrophosphokinase